METVACSLCGNNNLALIFQIPDYWLEKGDFFATFVRCEQCGLVFQNPRLNADEMASHYPESYEVFQHEPPKQPGFKFGMNRRSSFISRNKQSGRLLDIGCANGTFLKWMEQKGNWEVYGIEMSEYSAQLARKKGLNVITGTLQENDFQPFFFDAVTLWDVIEHLHNPVEILSRVEHLLKPDGILVLRLPNFSSIDSQLFGKYWAGWDAPRHLYVFNIPVIRAMLEKEGFRILTMDTRVGGYLNFVKSILFFMIGKKVKPVYRNIIVSLLRSLPVRLLMAPIFWLKDANLRGSELIIVAMKSIRE